MLIRNSSILLRRLILSHPWNKARCEVAERDNQALLDYVQELTSQTAPSPAKRLSSQNEVNELRAMNDQLVKNVREAREKAAELQWQLEQQESAPHTEDNARITALEGIIDDLLSILSKTLRVEGVGKGYQHASVDAMIFAIQVRTSTLRSRMFFCLFATFGGSLFSFSFMKREKRKYHNKPPRTRTDFMLPTINIFSSKTQRLVAKLQAELHDSIANPSELREAKESVRTLTTELRVYKKKCERLVRRLHTFRSLFLPLHL